jgi:DNA-binding response OmpR family regulator
VTQPQPQPQAPPQPQPQAPPNPQPQAPPKPQPPPRDQPQAWTATILVADDEQDIRELVAYRLSRSGYRIIEARDGEEAFQLAADQALDMAVLDVMMPRLNGFDLTQRLRHTPATARLPILLMSASVQEADISRGFAAGADGYLTKPFTPDQLLTRVREVLSRG